jgi:hypothetical protein
MTAALSLYSAVFMRYSLAITPANYLLFGCHFINCSSQLVQGYRYMQYWNWGGREKQQALQAADSVGNKAQGVVQQAVEKAKDVVGKK